MKLHLYRSYCAFAPGAAAPVESLLAHFKDEVRSTSAAGSARSGRPAASSEAN